jgi:hypothetical protein
MSEMVAIGTPKASAATLTRLRNVSSDRADSKPVLLSAETLFSSSVDGTMRGVAELFLY